MISNSSGNETNSPSNSLKNSFLNEWTALFGQNISFEEIQLHCFDGKLRDSRLRSVIWRVLLKVLPLDRQEWSKILEQSRKNYDSIKAKLNTNPRLSASDDPNHNNPLSLQDENPWHQYFLDEELRDCIRKDVERTFPDLQFFQSSKTKAIMSDVLFVYAKQNPHIAYRQGMHELLASIIFAIYFDHRSFEHLAEQNCLDELNVDDVKTLKTLNNPSYLEHDSFALFQQLVMQLENWYICDEEFMSGSPISDTEPFSNKDTVPNSELLRRLDYINEELLSKVDPILYRHLKSLDISVHFFGIRWLRLLFGREFHLHDLLFLWDVLFSDRPTLGLVDQVFLALLIQIRDLLLHSDYSACLQYLMRYPPIADIHSFIKLVLHLKSPKVYPKPKNIGLTQYAHITLAGTAHPNQNREITRPLHQRNSTNGKKSSNTTKNNKPVNFLLHKLGRQALAASPPNNRELYTYQHVNQNIPIKSRNIAETRSKFYIPIANDPVEQLHSTQFQLNSIQNRNKQAAQRLLSVTNSLEQQNLDHQGSIIIELRDIASLLNSAIPDENTHFDEPPTMLPPRSTTNSVGAQDEPSQRRQTINSQASELVEMYFVRKKNF